MKPIEGFSKYKIDECGNVYGPRGHIIAPHTNKGMLAVKIHNDQGKRIAVPIHRAVAAAYVGDPASMRVRHINGDLMDNSMTNLEVYDHRSSVEHKRALATSRCRRYANKYPEKVSQVGVRWRENNKAKVLASTRERQARKLQATPMWADKDKIQRHYDNAVYLSEVSGHKHHVDHIVPLRGKNVCGLHVEYNLRVVPHFINTRKGNKHTP